MRWKSFLIGLSVGVVLTLAAMWAIGTRYRIAPLSGILAVKLDTWTGKSWMTKYYDQPDGRGWYWIEIKN